jgi:hypothetical protein
VAVAQIIAKLGIEKQAILLSHGDSHNPELVR